MSKLPLCAVRGCPNRIELCQSTGTGNGNVDGRPAIYGLERGHQGRHVALAGPSWLDEEVG